MKLLRTLYLAFLLLLPLTAMSQLFYTSDFIFNGGERQGGFSQPRMHIEGRELYVCTHHGLYAKDLSTNNNWQLVGFEDIPLQDYARRGNDILALRYNEGGGFLLLSHDGGQTYEDVTPDIFLYEKHDCIPCLVQHPTDPNTLLVSSIYWGIFLSTDFGNTWENLTEFIYGNRVASFIGFHPTRPNIIYNSGESSIFEGHISISYDNGQTWNDHGNSLGFPGDNCAHKPAFHHAHPDRWLVGGEGCVFLSEDNGQTWSCQNYWNDESHKAYWYFSAFDNEHPDTAYMVGSLGKNGQKDACVKIMCSTDAGRSWHPSQIMPSEKEYEMVNDLQQYHDTLIVYTESNVYFVSKEELVAKSVTSIRSPHKEDIKDTVYDLQGRQRKNLMHGIIIENGRKAIK
ncbi:MAG: hypothetical protein AUK64_2039 [bacterium P201]|nr:MAG: hypothetical protein AUK64_2039 [bacterium P201]